MKPTHSFCAAILLPLAACVSARSPAALLRDKESGELTRIRAVAEMSAGDAKELWRVVFDGSDAMSVRAPAARKLLDADAEGFWKRVERDYRAVNRGPIWRWICEEAGKRKDERSLRVMVLFMSSPKGTAWEEKFEGRESAVIDTIVGRDRDVLMDVICGRQWAGDAKMQKAAWLALSQVNLRKGEETLLRSQSFKKIPPVSGEWEPSSLSEKIPDGSELAILKKFALLLDQNLMVDEEIEILRTQSTLPQLKNQTPVAPRGLPLARRNLLAASLTPLSPPVARTQDPPLNTKGTPSATDTAVCAEILRGLRTPAVVSALFREADRDLDDTRSEHGGLLCWNDENAVVFDAILPLVKRHNERYDPPEKLFERLRDGLAHVHFHAQAHDSGRYAGPGRGDMEFVENNRVNAVVFTFVDKDTLNADAYFPGGVVVDLGCVRRAK